VARSILIGSGSAWLLTGVGGLVLAVLGTERIEQLLPPLAIDTDALRGTIVAVGVGLLLVGAVHVAIVLGLRAGRRRAWTAGILMAAVMAATFLALAATSATSAAADSTRLVQYLAGAIGAGTGSVAYALVALRLVSEMKSGSAY